MRTMLIFSNETIREHWAFWNIIHWMSPNGLCTHLPVLAVKWTTIQRGMWTINSRSGAPIKRKMFYLPIWEYVCQPTKWLSPIWSGLKIGNKQTAASETSRWVQIDWILVINIDTDIEKTVYIVHGVKKAFCINPQSIWFSRVCPIFHVN